jgi:hypothetical protein
MLPLELAPLLAGREKAVWARVEEMRLRSGM